MNNDHNRLSNDQCAQQFVDQLADQVLRVSIATHLFLKKHGGTDGYLLAHYMNRAEAQAQVEFKKWLNQEAAA